jgi:Fe2+ or Zn2+ uptake regulation protein
LTAIRKRGPLTAGELHKHLREKVDVTAINNRLRRMAEMGLVRQTNKKKPRIFDLV